ncbi:MAG: citrate/2-methylcitrate synthase [Kiritimatiellaeota bacterium]|nr:citrate/2-methylcitrate synthase [Kiritimatiellota bacterium]
MKNQMHRQTKRITELIQEAHAAVPPSPDGTSELAGSITWPVECTVGPGLEGAIACATRIGYVNGRLGRLVYRGYDIFDLCAHSTFEEVSYLLLHGMLPAEEQLDRFRRKLVEYRFIPDTLRLIMSFPIQDMNPMAALRLGTNLMRQHQTTRDMYTVLPAGARVIGSDEDSVPVDPVRAGDKRARYEFRDRTLDRPRPRKAARDQKEARGVESCYHLIAGAATLAAAIARLRAGRLPIEPDPELSHAANFLYMLTGHRPDPVAERVLDVALILHADHGMNASTFAAMVVASTLSDIYFSIGSGIAALNGPLHGGANEQVLKMLLEIGPPERAAKWYTGARAAKRKVMGFGHRVYKTYDPRARILGPLAAYLVEHSGNSDLRALYDTAVALEQCVVADLGKRKGIFTNVDFYSGIVYSSMGIPVELFTPVFAVARVAGWTARVLEYLKHNRIFRPRAIYTGEFGREYVPIEARPTE